MMAIIGLLAILALGIFFLIAAFGTFQVLIGFGGGWAEALVPLFFLLLSIACFYVAWAHGPLEIVVRA